MPTPPARSKRGFNVAMDDADWAFVKKYRMTWSVTEHGEVRLYQPGLPGKTKVAATLRLAIEKLR